MLKIAEVCGCSQLQAVSAVTIANDRGCTRRSHCHHPSDKTAGTKFTTLNTLSSVNS